MFRLPMWDRSAGWCDRTVFGQDATARSPIIGTATVIKRLTDETLGAQECAVLRCIIGTLDAAPWYVDNEITDRARGWQDFLAAEVFGRLQRQDYLRNLDEPAFIRNAGELLADVDTGGKHLSDGALFLIRWPLGCGRSSGLLAQAGVVGLVVEFLAPVFVVFAQPCLKATPACSTVPAVWCPSGTTVSTHISCISASASTGADILRKSPSGRVIRVL